MLRPLLLADAPALFLALSDPEVQRYRRQHTHSSIEETERYIVETLQRSRAAWAISENGGEALGRLALRVDSVNGEFGIVLRRTAQRQGLGTKALLLGEQFAFNDLKLQTLNAKIDSENAASRALFARHGYLEIGMHVRDPSTKLGARDSIIVRKQRG